jgi:hypothetical protein
MDLAETKTNLISEQIVACASQAHRRMRQVIAGLSNRIEQPLPAGNLIRVHRSLHARAADATNHVCPRTTQPPQRAKRRSHAPQCQPSGSMHRSPSGIRQLKDCALDHSTMRPSDADNPMVSQMV